MYNMFVVFVIWWGVALGARLDLDLDSTARILLLAALGSW